MSPAERCTISPTTRSSIGISIFSCSLLVTVQVVVIMDNSFSAAFPLLDSCTKRSVPEIITMVRMITTVNGSKSSGELPNREKYGKTISVIVETTARQKRIAVKGLINAPARRFTRDCFFSCVTLFDPYFVRLTATFSSSSPRSVVCRLFKTSLIGLVAACSMRWFCSSRITACCAACRTAIRFSFLFIGLYLLVLQLFFIISITFLDIPKIKSRHNKPCDHSSHKPVIFKAWP